MHVWRPKTPVTPYKKQTLKNVKCRVLRRPRCLYSRGARQSSGRPSGQVHAAIDVRSSSVRRRATTVVNLASPDRVDCALLQAGWVYGCNSISRSRQRNNNNNNNNKYYYNHPKPVPIRHARRPVAAAASGPR